MIEDVPSFVQIIGNVGFPIGVSLYLLMRFEKKIDVLSEGIAKLSEVMKSHLFEGGKK